MTGRTTHDQQMRILEEHENTKNAPKEVDVKAELKRSAASARRGEGDQERPARPRRPGQSQYSSGYEPRKRPQ
jgi:hypothetical protein